MALLEQVIDYLETRRFDYRFNACYNHSKSLFQITTSDITKLFADYNFVTQRNRELSDITFKRAQDYWLNSPVTVEKKTLWGKRAITYANRFEQAKNTKDLDLFYSGLRYISYLTDLDAVFEKHFDDVNASFKVLEFLYDDFVIQQEKAGGDPYRVEPNNGRFFTFNHHDPTNSNKAELEVGKGIDISSFLYLITPINYGDMLYRRLNETYKSSTVALLDSVDMDTIIFYRNMRMIYSDDAFNQFLNTYIFTQRN